MSAIKDCMNKAKGYKSSGKKDMDKSPAADKDGEKSVGSMFKRMRKGK